MGSDKKKPDSKETAPVTAAEAAPAPSAHSPAPQAAPAAPAVTGAPEGAPTAPTEAAPAPETSPDVPDIAALVAAAIADADIDGKVEAAIATKLAAIDFVGGSANSSALAASGAAQTAAEAAVAAQTERSKKADKEHSERLEKQQKDAEKARRRLADGAKLAFGQLVLAAQPSALDAQNCDAISLRFGDGETFHPSVDLTVDAGDLAAENGRILNNKPINLAADLSAMTISEAYLICEGEGPAAIYRSRIEPPLSVGQGRSASFAKGGLAFALVNPPAA